MNIEQRLADRTHRIQSSAIREILKLIAKPGVVSLAGGLPSPDSFPLDIIEEMTHKVIEKFETRALQYDNTTGFAPFKEVLVDFLKTQGITTQPDNLIITSGSQGLLDGIGKILINRGDLIAVEAPTYLGAMSAFAPYGAQYVSMRTDDDGLIPESLAETLHHYDVKFVYLVPTFQNPTGRTITLERRKHIAEIIQQHDVLLVEDDPYSMLRYRGEAVPTIQQFAPEHVIYTSTLSKIFAPGLRIGYSVAPAEVCHWLEVSKQAVDLHTSTFNQALAAEYFSGGYYDAQLPKILDVYRPKQQAMLSALQKHFPADLHWSDPDGGMFIWVEGPAELDMLKVYYKAIENNVAFVPGQYFYANNEEFGRQTFRLNYTMPSIENIETAVQKLGLLLEEELAINAS